MNRDLVARRDDIISTRIELIRRWLKILFGKSYFHVPQPPGKYMEVKSINGYYNDLTRKAAWEGESDEEDIPINRLSNGEAVYSPITIAQMALGTYDLWLEKKDSMYMSRFLKLARWLKSNQDNVGGWLNPWNYTRPGTFTNYSAMAQGEGISVLARAFLETHDSSFTKATDIAYRHMMSAVENGGCSYYGDGEIYLEEYPEKPRSTVLNGYIFALFGVYDYMLLSRDENVCMTLNTCLSTLERNLEHYDTGFWTYYDLHGTLCSPFYHSLHISLLDSLFMLTGRQSFKYFSSKWLLYEKNRLYKTKALFAKIFQKLKGPSHVTIKI